jgi:hypothetical protein
MALQLTKTFCGINGTVHERLVRGLALEQPGSR